MNEKLRIYFATSLIFAAILINSESGLSSPFLHIDAVDGKSNYPHVKVLVTINSFNDFDIATISEDDLNIYEDGYRVHNIKVNNISDTEDFLYIVLAIDSSMSISKDFFKGIKDISKELISRSDKKDRIALYSFNDSAILLKGFDGNNHDLIKSIDSIQRHGRKTILFNAVYDSIEMLSKAPHAIKGVIVFTDGKDEGSSVQENDIIHFARMNSSPIYFLYNKNSKNKGRLERISRLTGGKAASILTPHPASMFRKVLRNVKHRKYAIEYKTNLQPDGNNHTLEVRLKNENIRDRETAIINFERSVQFYFKPSFIMNTLLFLILCTLLLLFTAIIYYIKSEVKKRNKDGSTGVDDFSQDSLKNEIQLEENERIQEIKTLSSINPEYNYTHAWLMQKDGPATGRKYPIYWNECTLGRCKDNSIEIDDEAVSPYQAKIKLVRSNYYLYDLVSENGTYLNGKKLLRPKTLFDWDEIRVGRTTFVFRGSKRAL